MALLKTVIKNNGITTSYHKVSYVGFNQEGNSYYANAPLNMSVKLTSYLNEEYRQNERPIESEMYYFNITSDEEQSTSARKLAYSKLKSLDEWADAIDC